MYIFLTAIGMLTVNIIITILLFLTLGWWAVPTALLAHLITGGLVGRHIRIEASKNG